MIRPVSYYWVFSSSGWAFFGCVDEKVQKESFFPDELFVFSHHHLQQRRKKKEVQVKQKRVNNLRSSLLWNQQQTTPSPERDVLGGGRRERRVRSSTQKEGAESSRSVNTRGQRIARRHDARVVHEQPIGGMLVVTVWRRNREPPTSPSERW